jgi:hypothetical protein
MLIVGIDDADLIRQGPSELLTRRLRILREITGEELEQIADGDLTALDTFSELTPQAA